MRDNVTVIVADVVRPGDGTTQPQVVGAVSELGTAPTDPGQTPAEKAAALARHIQGEPEAPALAEESSPSTLLTWLRRGLLGVAVLVVVVGGAWASYEWSQRQYFVGETEGQVTIFRGVAQDLGPWVLSTPEESTDLAVTDLPTYYQSRVRSTLSADDRADADAIVAELRSLVVQDCTPIPVVPPVQLPDIVLPLPNGDSATVTAPPPLVVLPEGCEP